MPQFWKEKKKKLFFFATCMLILFMFGQFKRAVDLLQGGGRGTDATIWIIIEGPFDPPSKGK